MEEKEFIGKRVNLDIKNLKRIKKLLPNNKGHPW